MALVSGYGSSDESGDESGATGAAAGAATGAAAGSGSAAASGRKPSLLGDIAAKRKALLAMPTVQDDGSDDEDEAGQGDAGQPASKKAAGGKSGLFAMLPQPKRGKKVAIEGKAMAAAPARTGTDAASTKSAVPATTASTFPAASAAAAATASATTTATTTSSSAAPQPAPAMVPYTLAKKQWDAQRASKASAAAAPAAPASAAAKLRRAQPEQSQTGDDADERPRGSAFFSLPGADDGEQEEAGEAAAEAPGQSYGYGHGYGYGQSQPVAQPSYGYGQSQSAAQPSYGYGQAAVATAAVPYGGADASYAAYGYGAAVGTVGYADPAYAHEEEAADEGEGATASSISAALGEYAALPEVAKLLKGGKEQVKIVDIKDRDRRETFDEWQAHREEYKEQANAMMPLSTGPGGVGKRKSQMTYLAQQAVANDAKLRAQWASQAQNRSASRTRYGF